MAVELGSERLRCKHTRQFLCHHWCLKFDKCDERRHAELTLVSPETPAIALDAPTQKQVVYKRWIIQDSVVLAWKQSWCQPPKVTNDWSEHAIALLRPPKNGKTRSLSARDTTLRAKGQRLAPSASSVRSNNQEGNSSSSGSALPLAPPPAPPPLEPPPLAKWSLEQETEMTDETVEQQGEPKRRREHPEATQAADSNSRSSSSESSTDTEMNGLGGCVYDSLWKFREGYRETCSGCRRA